MRAILAAIVFVGCSFDAGGPGVRNDASTDGDPGIDVSTSELVNRGLIARYFINEAAAGTTPATVFDAADNPLDMTVTYDSMQFVETGGHRGLQWSAIEVNGRASVPTMGTKVEVLSGATSATIEAVFEVQSPSPMNSRILNIGEQGNTRLGLRSNNPATLDFNWEASIEEIGLWDIDLPSAGRIVAHAVLDSTQSDPNERVKLYVDGVLLLPNRNSGRVMENEPINLPSQSDMFMVLGNREIGERSFEGTLYYAAVYSSAFSADEARINAQLLSANDD